MAFNTDNRVACRNCIFFDKLPIQKKEDTILGACKSNPPTPAPADPFDWDEEEPANPTVHKKGRSKLGIWHLVLGHFWCGDFTDVREETRK